MIIYNTYIAFGSYFYNTQILTNYKKMTIHQMEELGNAFLIYTCTCACYNW